MLKLLPKLLYHYLNPIYNRKNKIFIYNDSGQRIGYADKISLSWNQFYVLNNVYIHKKYVDTLFSGKKFEYLCQDFKLKLFCTNNYLDPVCYPEIWITSLNSYISFKEYILFTNVGFNTDHCDPYFNKNKCYYHLFIDDFNFFTEGAETDNI